MSAREALTVTHSPFQAREGGSSPARALTIVRCTTTVLRAAARDFTNAHHSYIKWADRPSRKLYWNLYEQERQVGVFGLASAFTFPRAIKDFQAEHSIGFNELGNNIVFCLFGARHKNAGSILLRLLRRDASKWWRERYGDRLLALQTFILPPRTGAVYRADNWQELGLTSGATVASRTVPEGTPGASRKRMRDGTVLWLSQTAQPTEQKIILVRLLRD